MVSLDSIFAEYEKENIRLYNYKSPIEAATIEIDGEYGVFMDFAKCQTIAEIKGKLAHEYGHAATGATHRLSSPFDLIEKHEHLANKKAALQFIPPNLFTVAFKHGLCEAWQIAEFFDMPETDVRWAAAYYTKNGFLN